MTTSPASDAAAPIRAEPCASRSRLPIVADVLVLAASIALVAIVATVGRQWTDTGPGTWYDRLDRPPWNPPGFVFGIVWTVLYLMMAVAAWLVARRNPSERAVRRALALYAVQLLLNLGWTALFFGLERPGWALAEVVVLIVAVAVTTIAFARISPVAAGLLAPYLLWVCFAMTLNLAIVAMNAPA